MLSVRALILLTLSFMPVYSAPELRVVTAAHRGALGRISVDGEGKQVLTCSIDKTAKLWDGEGNLLRTFYPPAGDGQDGMLYACALSPDGALAAVGGRDLPDSSGFYSVYLFSSSSAIMIARLGGLPQVTADLEFSSDGRYLAAGLYGSGGVVVFDVYSHKIAARLGGFKGDVTGCGFDRSGKLAAACSDGSIRLFGNRFQREGYVALSGGALPYSVAFSPDGASIAAGFRNRPGILILDVFTMRENGFIQGPPESFLTCVGWQQRGAVVAVCTDSLRKVALVRENEVIYLKGLAGPVYDLQVSGDKVLISDINGLRFVNMYGDILVSHRNQSLDFAENPPAISADGAVIRFAPAGLPSLVFSAKDKVLMRADRAGGAFKQTAMKGNLPFCIPGKPVVLCFAQTDSLIIAGTYHDLYCFNRRGVIKWRKPQEAAVRSLGLAPDAGLAVAAMGDGTIRWVRTGNGERVLSLFIREDLREWAMWSPDGRWEASKNGSSLLSWFVNRGNGSEEQVFGVNMLFREKKGLKSLGEFSAEKAQLISWQIESPRNNDTLADTVAVLKIRLNDSSAPVLSLGLEVNGVAQMTTYRGLVPRYGRMVHMVPVILGKGQNRVVLKAYADGCVAVKELDLFCRPPEGSRSFPKPVLHALLAGISRYRNPALELQYGSTGAMDMAEELRRQKGGLYSGVETRMLVDSCATGDAILDGMEWLRKKAMAADVTVLYLAGHGVYDGEGKAYFVPFDGDTGSLRRSCVAFSEIRWYMERIPGKVVLFLDACYSGAIASRIRGFFPDLEGAVREMTAAESGCIIFSSSSADQFSQEDRLWGNSAFTRALLEGLGGKADMAGDGIITSGMLELYISKRVKELTGGTQTPVIAKPYAMRDFPVALTPELTGGRL